MNVCPVCRAERPQTPAPNCPKCGQAYPIRVEITLIPADWPAPFRVGDAHDVRLEDGIAVWSAELPPRTVLRDAVRAALQRFWIAHWDAEWTAVSATGGRLDPSRTLDEVWAHQKRPPAVRLTVAPTSPRKPAPSPVAPSPFPDGPAGLRMISQTLPGAEPTARPPRAKLGQILLDLGLVNRAQLDEGLGHAKRRRVRMGEALVELGFCDETAIVKALAAQHEVPFRDLAASPVPREALQLLPEAFVRRCRVLPLSREGDRLRVIVGDPTDLDVLDEIAFRYKVEAEVSGLALRSDIVRNIEIAFGPSDGSVAPEADETMQVMTQTDIDIKIPRDARRPASSKPQTPPPPPPRRPSPDTVGAAPVVSKPQPRPSPPTGGARAERDEAAAAASAVMQASRSRMGLREMRDDRAAEMDMASAEGTPADLARAGGAPGGVPQPGGHRRRASVRWFRRMNPERIFPLTVVLAKARIRAVRVENVSQAVSAEMLVIPETSPILLVRPVLAGCTCFPPEQKIDVSADTATARFRVLPQLVGVVEDARIELYSGDKLLSQIPLQVEVCRQTAAKVLSAVGLGWPLVNGMMGGPEAKASMLTAAVTGVLQTPGIVEAGLVGLGVAAVWSYLRNRPEEAGEDTDVPAVRPLSAAELIADGRKALAERRWTDAIGLFEDAVNVAPTDRDARAGLAAALRHGRGPERALEALDAAAAAGATSAETELIRGACLAVLKRPDEAVAALRRAVQLGLPRPRLSTEPDLAALRYDRGFLELQSRR